jgi:signal transduction histidine kinase
VVTQPKPVYILGPNGRVPAGFVPGSEPRPLAHAADMRGAVPGMLLLPVRELPAEELLQALLIAAEAPVEAPWLPVLVEPDAKGEPRARPISVGWPVAPGELARWTHGEPAVVLELRYVLARVARSRHDLNNPLTSAMAETQLAQMDTSEPQVRAGLETVQQQLKRMREMIAGLKALRPPPG